jgi:hypothetical protein
MSVREQCKEWIDTADEEVIQSVYIYIKNAVQKEKTNMRLQNAIEEANRIAYDKSAKFYKSATELFADLDEETDDV